MERVTNILVECPDLLPSVRVGVLNPLKPLIDKKKCNVMFKKTLEIKKKEILWCDVLICVRGCELASLKVVKAARDAGRYIIYFLDDDLLDVPNNIDSSVYFSSKSIKDNLVSCLTNADLLWCVNPLIGQKYSRYCHNTVTLRVPSIIDVDYYKDESEYINILYAGSKDHEKGVKEFVSPALDMLCKEFNSKIKVTSIGADLGLSHHKNYIHHKYIDNYDVYREYVTKGNFNIGIAFVRNEEFYKYKYYNKYIEYTSIGSVGIYSNLEPYIFVIKDRFNGILCKNTVDDWYNKLKDLIIDSELRKHCYINAKANISEEFRLEIVSKELETLIPQITSYFALAKSEKDIRLPNLILICYIQTFKYLIKKYGVLVIFIAPYKIVKKIFRKFFVVEEKK